MWRLCVRTFAERVREWCGQNRIGVGEGAIDYEMHICLIPLVYINVHNHIYIYIYVCLDSGYSYFWASVEEKGVRRNTKNGKKIAQ